MQTEILERGTKKDFSRMFDPKNGTHFEKIFGAVPDNSAKGLLWVLCARAV